jgi:F0F1-type ATP synthase membrane subunit b/b'
MSVLLSTFILLLSEPAGGGTWAHIYENYLNVPGFEAWKFLNLFVFLAVMFYLLKTPLSEGFKAKREAIRADLIKAEQEKKAALAQLTAAEARLAQLGSEKEAVLQKAREEAAADKRHLTEMTESEIKRMTEQVEGELARLDYQIRAELRRFSAEESIRLAEQKLRSRIDAANDARLVKANIQEIGGLN